MRTADLQADVQPGVVYDALNRRLRGEGLFFPPQPGGSADWATIGGMVANNASGIWSVKYGGTRDHVRAATLVTGTAAVAELDNQLTADVVEARAERGPGARRHLAASRQQITASPAGTMIRSGQRNTSRSSASMWNSAAGSGSCTRTM